MCLTGLLTNVLPTLLWCATCRAVFTLAAKLQPCVIFIDEVDALLGKRNSNREHEALRCGGWQAVGAGCGALGGQGPCMLPWRCIARLLLCMPQ